MLTNIDEVECLETLPKTSRLSVEQILRDLPQPIAFVGNGPISNEYGAFIDDHATVIRCNNFVLDGFESNSWHQNYALVHSRED